MRCKCGLDGDRFCEFDLIWIYVFRWVAWSDNGPLRAKKWNGKWLNGIVCVWPLRCEWVTVNVYLPNRKPNLFYEVWPLSQINLVDQWIIEYFLRTFAILGNQPVCHWRKMHCSSFHINHFPYKINGSMMNWRPELSHMPSEHTRHTSDTPYLVGCT